jgi:hypothetical protein
VSFEFHIPRRDDDDSIVEAIDAANETLSGDELAVTEKILWSAFKQGTVRVGDVLEHIEQASPEERRRIADKARKGGRSPNLQRDRGEPAAGR